MSKDYTYEKAMAELRDRIARFEKVEGRPWNAEGGLIELTKQVGELAKLVMTHEGYYFAGREQESKYEVSKARLADEIADIFFALIRVADHYDIDLLEASKQARIDEDELLKTKGV